MTQKLIFHCHWIKKIPLIYRDKNQIRNLMISHLSGYSMFLNLMISKLSCTDQIYYFNRVIRQEKDKFFVLVGMTKKKKHIG